MSLTQLKNKQPEAHTTHLGAGRLWVARPGVLRGVAWPLSTSSSQPCPPACSELTLSHIGVGASGEWECSVSTVQGNASKKVEIVVLEISASYCPAERVANNRGDFRFGVLSCPRDPTASNPAPHHNPNSCI